MARSPRPNDEENVNIRVAVRVRPMIRTELVKGHHQSKIRTDLDNNTIL